MITRIFKTLMFLGLLSTSLQADLTIGGKTFTQEQLENFKLAYSYGLKIGEPKTMMAILNTESNGHNIVIGDKVNQPFKRSYGPMQVKVDTYYWTKDKGYIDPLDVHYGLEKEEVLVHLMKDRNFNVYVATGFYKMMRDSCKDYSFAVMAYNRGHCKDTKEGRAYLKKVRSFINFINQTNFDKIIADLIAKEGINYNSPVVLQGKAKNINKVAKKKNTKPNTNKQANSSGKKSSSVYVPSSTRVSSTDKNYNGVYIPLAK